ncbi:hypothetical protein Tco_1119516 [Tanacetum coccineum]
MVDENPIRTLGDYSRPSHKGFRNTIELHDGNNVVTLVNLSLKHGLVSRTYSKKSSSWHRYLTLSLIFYDHVNPVIRRTIDQAADGKIHDKNAKESWAVLEDLALYDKESWNDPRDFVKPVKAISLPQDVPSISDHRLLELENQVQRLMEAYLAPNPPVQQAFVDYASLHSNEVGGLEKSRRRVRCYKPVIEEGESRDIKWDDLNGRMCRDTKEVDKVEKESEESKEEVEE